MRKLSPVDSAQPHLIFRRRKEIYVGILWLGLLILALGTLEYHAGFSLLLYLWAFPLGWLQQLGAVGDGAWHLAIGYLGYLLVWWGLSAVKKPSSAVVLLVLHLILVILTVSGCHGVVRQLPH